MRGNIRATDDLNLLLHRKGIAYFQDVTTVHRYGVIRDPNNPLESCYSVEFSRTPRRWDVDITSKGRNALWKQGTRIQELPKLTHGGGIPKAIRIRCDHLKKDHSPFDLFA